MPRIFDNISTLLLPALQSTLHLAHRADFCVGYFNLRGWKDLQDVVDGWQGGPENCVRLMVGMQRMPQEELRAALDGGEDEGRMTNERALALKKRLAQEFREQLAVGTPSNQDEATLRRLAGQIRAGKVVVKLFLRHPLHAKLYLLHRHDPINPIVAYLGSSNLTFSGLSAQGELNVDVLDDDAGNKLALWFDERWKDRFCIDISNELVQIIEESWAREDLLPPYYIYLKMAYHLSQEARTGLAEFRIPGDLNHKLLDFQAAAVKIAAHHLHRRGGVLIGDVVGLGKTLVGTAVARIFDDDLGYDTLILCPKNLVKMWESYRDQYRLRARVLSISQVQRELPGLRRYRLVMIDESHNLRNREGKRYQVIREYVEQNECKVILLSATPYNKSYLDLSSQLRLFLPPDRDLGIRPEQLLREIGAVEFSRRYQAALRSLEAFYKSEHAEDWQDLMRLFMVRRTRSFIKDNYAQTDPETGRRCLVFSDGSKSPFPDRLPLRVEFALDENDPHDQYARLYAEDVVEAINDLELPRYGLGNYILERPKLAPTPAEKRILSHLSRAGRRLMGFSRTNLFKRLESSGYAFLLSIERHILRNTIFLHAIEHDLPLPIGTQDAELLDARFSDEERDADLGDPFDSPLEGEEAEPGETEVLETSAARPLYSEADFRQRAAEVYGLYATQFQRRFQWLRPGLFKQALAAHLRQDSQALLDILLRCGAWQPAGDAKLQALRDLLTGAHANDKVLIFTQFADTVRYLEAQLQAHVPALQGVTGDSEDPTGLAWRFSPLSNARREQTPPEQELRVLIATDVLSEGQNLQDSFVVVNYDLPWAIIRLIQRAGRVDRLGQRAGQIYCYSFLPAEGVERIIRLRERVRDRLRQNAEVVGADEAFFDDEADDQAVLALYHEKAGILDGDDVEGEVDLASYAYQIWKNATDANPSLQRIIPDLPPVSFSARAHQPTPREPQGVLAYLRTAEGSDALAWIDQSGQSVSESQYTILRAAACSLDTPALPRSPEHHSLVQKAVELAHQQERAVGGQLGRPTSPRARAYERLRSYAERIRGQFWDTQELRSAVQEIYDYPLTAYAVDILNRQLRSGISDDELADLATGLRSENRLCLIQESESAGAPRIICSLGLNSHDPDHGR